MNTDTGDLYDARIPEQAPAATVAKQAGHHVVSLTAAEHTALMALPRAARRAELRRRRRADRTRRGIGGGRRVGR